MEGSLKVIEKVEGMEPIHIPILRRMLRREFESCGWYDSEHIASLAGALGFDDLAAEMRVDSEFEEIIRLNK